MEVVDARAARDDHVHRLGHVLAGFIELGEARVRDTTVVIHYTASGADAAAEEIDVLGEEGLKITEGVVTDIDRGKKEITIRYANGKTETLQMTKRAAAESGAGIEESSEGAHIVVYYADESGRKVAHYFKKVS